MLHVQSSIHSSILAAGLAVALAGGASTALAAQRATERATVTAPSEQFAERINHADLNLADRSARRVLMSRVGSAVHRVCGPGRFDAGLSRDEQMGCEEAAWTDAKPQIALAVERATQIARNGFSALPEVALTISVPASGAL